VIFLGNNQENGEDEGHRRQKPSLSSILLAIINSSLTLIFIFYVSVVNPPNLDGLATERGAT